ncbi:MAG: glycosyltransferase family 39 protein, partial [Ilumatobacteraceae bacterium]
SSPQADEAAMLSRWLLLAGLASLLLRLWIAVTFPISGDEAFFYWWGVYPDWGYSDHPPMVGWLIALMRATLGDSLWSIRLPAVLLPLGLGAALWTEGMNLMADVIADVLGPRLIADTGEWGTYAWGEHVLGAPGYRIAGGSDETQRNIIGERVLGLPGEPRVDKDVAWRDILR